MKYSLALYVLYFSISFSSAQNVPVDVSSASPQDVSSAVIEILNDPRVAETVARARAQGGRATTTVRTDGSTTRASAPSPATGARSEARAETPRTAARRERPFIVGMEIDAGLPHVMGASVIVRPWEWLRIHAGGMYNFASPGIRGGLTFALPVHWAIFQDFTLTGEGGHFFEGDANGVARFLLGDAGLNNAVLRRVSYDYVTGELGVELLWNRFRLFIRGGITYVHSTLHDFQAAVREASGDTTITVTNPDVQLIAPSGRLGLSVYFY